MGSVVIRPIGSSTMRIRSRGVVWLGAAFCATAFVAANAAETSAPAELETITVTAQKRSESEQTVPLSMTTFGAAALQEKAVVNFFDYGGVISISAFERHAETERILRLVPGSLTWLGPLDPATDPLWASMLRDEITEREYWAFRANEVGLAVGESGWDMLTMAKRLRGANPNAVIRP